MPRLLPVALLLCGACAGAAPREYRYVEGEQYAATEGPLLPSPEGAAECTGNHG